MSLFKKNLILLMIVLVLVAAPLIINRNATFNGSDSAAEKAITEMNPNYHPWFHSVWKPPSTEVESFLFAAQAAAGAGFIGYYFGYMKGKKSKRE